MIVFYFYGNRKNILKCHCLIWDFCLLCVQTMLILVTEKTAFLSLTKFTNAGKSNYAFSLIKTFQCQLINIG